MYRELASLDAFGVPGGPYTGAPRTLRYPDLPESVQQRLLRCLAREELPSPLLTVRAPRRRVGAWPLLAVLVAGVVVRLAGMQQLVPGWVLPLLVALFGLSGFAVQRFTRRDHLPPGMYLFPLDIVEASGNTLRITPMGSLRNAGIRRSGNALSLELKFSHGAAYRFDCPDEASAERAYAKIIEAHAAVERVTFGRDLEETVDLDPLFAIRGEDEPPRQALGFAWPLLGAVVGAAVGALCFVGFSIRADNRVWERVQDARSRVELQRYLDAGGRWHRAEAELLLEADGRTPAPPVTPSPPDPASARVFVHQPDSALTPAQRTARATAQQEAIMRYTTHVLASDATSTWQRNLHFGGYLDQIFQAARDHGDDGLYFVFERTTTTGLTDYQATALERAVRAREDRFVQAFAQVLSETIPTSLLTVARLEPGYANGRAFAVHVTTRVSRAHPGAGMAIDFDVAPMAGDTKLGAAFSLAMPAPPEPLTAVRPRSLFHLPEGIGLEHEADLLTARAFDRLYDEVFSFFFPGNPVVPLAAEVP